MPYLCFIWFFIALLSHPLCAESLSTKIDELINKELPHATVAVYVKEARSGQLIYTRNADKLLAPASNIKLFTAAAALYYWKPEHRFSTTLLKDKKNYYVNFGGSPSLTADNLTSLTLQLKNDNTQLIEGDIVLDISRFQPPYYTNGISYDDLGWYYAAPDTAVILNKNTVNYELVSAEKIGDLAILKAKSPDQKITVINEITTVNKEQKKRCGLNIEIKPENTLRLFGCVGQQKNPKILQLAITDPVFLAQQIIQKTLVQNHIKFKGKIILGTTPADASIVSSLLSDPVSKLIYHMLQESDNLYADNLTKQLAYSHTKEGTYRQAMYVLKDILAHKTKLDMTQLELADGIGTRYNLATAEQIAILLTNLYQNKSLFPLLFSSLPQSGVSGSLKDRMKKTILEKKVYAKTGTMHDISALSGYLVSPHGKSIIFSIIINGVNKPISKAKALEEQILMLIEQEVNGDYPPAPEFA